MATKNVKDTPVPSFAVNVYATSDGQKKSSVVDDLLPQVDDSQAESVRTILNRFAITGIATGRDPSRDSYIAEMSDDHPLDDEKVNDLLDTPDLSMMDEMEIHDLIENNYSITKKEEKPEAAPPMDAAATPSEPSDPE